MQVALVNQLRDWGIVPDSIVGHSSGEVPAAYASGAITADMAIIISYLRGRVIGALPKDPVGAMAAIGTSPNQVQKYLKEGVIVGCMNSPESVTLSGDEESLLQTLEQIRANEDGVFCKRLAVDKAYHSRTLTFVSRYLLLAHGLMNFNRPHGTTCEDIRNRSYPSYAPE